jgi:hypothetical protein
MDEPFELPVTYKNEALLLPARLVQQGFIHRFLVDVQGCEVSFEPDEEGCYRALIEPGTLEEKEKVDIELLKAIAGAIDDVLK